MVTQALRWWSAHRPAVVACFGQPGWLQGLGGLMGMSAATQTMLMITAAIVSPAALS